LLQGAFDTNDNVNNTSSYWRYPIGLTAAYILIFTGGLFAQNIMLEHNLDKQETKLTESYLKAFPGSKKPRNVNDLANKLRSRLSDNSSDFSAILPIGATELISFSAQASISSPVRVLGITLDSNSAELLVSGESIERLDIFKNTLQSNIGSTLILNMDSVSSKDEQYQGKISIRSPK
jgi:type II secretory pathway component PulL